MDEAPIDLAPLEREIGLRAQRITRAVARRIVRESAEQMLARWAASILLAAAASLVILFMGRPQPSGEAFAAFVVARRPAAVWVTSGRRPDLAEVVTIAGGGR